MADGCQYTASALDDDFAFLTDAVNQARAMRVAEIISDFRDIQHFIANIHAAPSAQDYHEEAYEILRRCTDKAQVLLDAPFNAVPTSPHGDQERERIQLQQ